ncbi:MAG: hypothetical protein ACREX0_11630 [Noviherbaspirillum sp.]
MTIVAARGAVHLGSAPICVGESLVAEKFSLPEGEAYMAQRAGWILISARSNAEVICLPDQSQRHSVFTRLRVILSDSWRLWRSLVTGARGDA